MSRESSAGPLRAIIAVCITMLSFMVLLLWTSHGEARQIVKHPLESSIITPEPSDTPTPTPTSTGTSTPTATPTKKPPPAQPPTTMPQPTVTVELPPENTAVPIATARPKLATPVPEATQPPDTPAPPPPAATTTALPSTPVPLDGMVLAQAISPAEADQWQVTVCVANFGTRTATGVVIKLLWPAAYHLLALRQLDGHSTFDETSVDFSMPDLAAGAQTQVTLLLMASNADAATPAIQADLSYSDGPARVNNVVVDCRPDGISAAAGTAQKEDTQKAPADTHTPTTAPAAPQASAQRAEDAPSILEPPNIELAAASWQCFVLPALLFGAAAALLVVKLSRRRIA